LKFITNDNKIDDLDKKTLSNKYKVRDILRSYVDKIMVGNKGTMGEHRLTIKFKIDKLTETYLKRIISVEKRSRKERIIDHKLVITSSFRNLTNPQNINEERRIKYPIIEFENY